QHKPDFLSAAFHFHPPLVKRRDRSGRFGSVEKFLVLFHFGRRKQKSQGDQREQRAFGHQHAGERNAFGQKSRDQRAHWRASAEGQHVNAHHSSPHLFLHGQLH